ncbi:hypothetical protein DXG01_009256 [Tephrocybe rancida]|nr:hypothetical protein DXG01_009256 [Tephrocybe rancida]
MPSTPANVKFFINDPTSRRAPWTYTSGPALQYCLAATGAALLSPPVLDLLVSTLLGDPSTSNISSKNYAALTNAVQTLLTSSIIPLNLTRVSQFAQTLPSPSTHNHLPTILLDHELVFAVDTANDPFLCFTLVTMILHEVNHWLRFRLLSEYGFINCDYGGTVEQGEAIRTLRRGVEGGTKDEFKRRLFGFEEMLLGGVTVLVLSDKEGLCHYIDGFALEKRRGTRKKEQDEVRVLESRSDIACVLAQLFEGRISLPLFDWDALPRDRYFDHENNGTGQAMSKATDGASDFSELESESSESSISDASEWEEPDDELRREGWDEEGGYLVISH